MTLYANDPGTYVVDVPVPPGYEPLPRVEIEFVKGAAPVTDVSLVPR